MITLNQVMRKQCVSKKYDKALLTMRCLTLTVLVLLAENCFATSHNDASHTDRLQHNSDLTNAHESLMLVKKQKHDIARFTTFGGELIKDVKVGWESYGTLNKEKTNTILITHYFTGTSHAAGKYSKDDEESGYWDSIIGAGKAIDTDKFFVISIDSLANINAYDESVITTGPSSIDPDTGKPYGMTFPVVTMRDFVNVQKSVLDSLGIQTLHAVAGPSMGSMQAIEWASAYPDMVPRLISVIGAAQADGWNQALLQQWVLPIKLDPNWQNGDYYQHPRSQWPQAGLAAALAFITQSALAPEFFNQVNQQLANDTKNATDLYDIQQNPQIVNWLMQRAQMRAHLMDANHLLYLVRANQLFMAGMQGSLREGLAKIKAKTLFIPASKDLLLMPYHSEQAKELMQTLGKKVDLVYLDGSLGHLEGVSNVYQHAETIRKFLAQ